MFTHNSNANASAMVTMCADELETVFQEMAGTSPGGGDTPYSGLYREAPPERGAFCKLAVYKTVGKIAILV